MKRWSKSSLQVIDPKASAAPSWSGMMSATTARPPSDPLDGQCMQSVCSPRCPATAQATARAPWCHMILFRQLTIWRRRSLLHINVHVDTRKQLNRAGYRRSCSSPRMAMVLERIVELSHAMMKTKYNGRLWLPAAYFRRS